MDHLTLVLERVPAYNTLKKWRLSDLLLCFFFLVCDFKIPMTVFQRQFYINDLTISHPFTEVETVNNKDLFIYSFIIPIIVIFVLILISRRPENKLYLLYVSLLGLSLSIISTSLITNYLKNCVGRLRPDFLARCKPKPNTPLNVLVSASEVCTSSDIPMLLDGFRTTPSGHSSLSFSGLGYLYFWLCGRLMSESPSSGSWRKVVACLPLVGAVTIALSRTEDYRHHFVDVIIGSCIGISIGYWAYRKNFPSIYDPVPFKPLLDDNETTVEHLPRYQDEGIVPLGSMQPVTQG